MKALKDRKVNFYFNTTFWNAWDVKGYSSMVKVIINKIGFTIQSFIVNLPVVGKQYIRQTLVQHFLLDIPQC